MTMDGGDIRVAVLSERGGLDLAINMWLPGYVARRCLDPRSALRYAGHRGAVLLDDAHCDVVLALADAGSAQLAIISLVGQHTPPTLDLDRGVLVASACTIPELRRALEDAVDRRRGRSPVRDARQGESLLFGDGTPAVPQLTDHTSLWTAQRPPG